MSAKPNQQSLSEKALREKKRAGSEDAHRPDNSATADEGMVATPREDYPPSGAFDAEGHEPAFRRSRER